ncbi:hypothetical protein ILYODFUR_032221 [Ilyodon furcidens]|uniref:Uncharacterized protein n=1 Tax=Ilyodon furcidens TaxID=33524 RepID=A0ABV0T216_9TELE
MEVAGTPEFIVLVVGPNTFGNIVYLSSRGFSVLLGQLLSSIAPLKHRVPQGSILGPFYSDCTCSLWGPFSRNIMCHSIFMWQRLGVSSIKILQIPVSREVFKEHGCP